MNYGTVRGSTVTISKADNPALSAFIEYNTELDINKLSGKEWLNLCNDNNVTYYLTKSSPGEKLYGAIIVCLTGKLNGNLVPYSKTYPTPRVARKPMPLPF